MDASVTLQTYLITPIRLNEVQLHLGKLIRYKHTPIITEEFESPRRDMGDYEAISTPVATDTTPTVTSVATNVGGFNIYTIANMRKAAASLIDDSAFSI